MLRRASSILILLCLALAVAFAAGQQPASEAGASREPSSLGAAMVAKQQKARECADSCHNDFIVMLQYLGDVELGREGKLSSKNWFIDIASDEINDPDGDPYMRGLVFCLRQCDRIGPLALTPEESAWCLDEVTAGYGWCLDSGYTREHCLDRWSIGRFVPDVTGRLQFATEALLRTGPGDRFRAAGPSRRAGGGRDALYGRLVGGLAALTPPGSPQTQLKMAAAELRERPSSARRGAQDYVRAAGRQLREHAFLGGRRFSGGSTTAPRVFGAPGSVRPLRG